MALNVTNMILDALPPRVRERINSSGALVDLKVDDLLYDRGVEIRFVYFPRSGFISRVASVEDRPRMEMVLTGREGMLGASLLTGVSQAPLRAMVRGAGTALQLSVADFQLELQNSEAFRTAVGEYLYVLLASITSTAVCSRFHAVGPRLARWLLVTHDRANADYFDLTHQVLSDMLGVQRSAVSIAANLLQEQGCISYTRGRVIIINRPALALASCDCYRVMADQIQSEALPEPAT